MAKAQIFDKHSVSLHRLKEWKDFEVSPHINKQLKLNNPLTAVLNLRSAPFNPAVLASHSKDDSNTYIWRVQYQGDMSDKDTDSTPDIT